jgi:hypothetical protein
MITTPTRKMVRVTDGAGYIQLLAVAGITTVLATRAYLAATGYPQVGGGTLHIAHVLWGGLLMLGGLVSALLFVGRSARVLAALLGGVGLGLFVDEIGKFLTKSNDYFFRPAAAIIYLVFAGLLVLTSQLHRRQPADRLANAAQIATTGLISGLTQDQREAALLLLADRDDQEARAVRQLLDAAPARLHPTLAKRLTRRPAAILDRLATKPQVTTVVIAFFVFTQLVTAIVFIVQALLLATGHHLGHGTDDTAVLGSAVTRTASACLAVVGVTRLRRDRLSAYRWFRAALLVNLLITQVFNFEDSQFAAVTELPFNLLVFVLLSFGLKRLRPASPA